MDLDGDGRMDVLSGSYMPGDLYLFAGAAGGAFAAPRVLADADHQPLRVGRASWPCAGDWDRDGDLDLVIGNMAGKVFLARNKSGGKRLAFAQPEPLLVGGVPLELVATNAAPCLADWDGDGAADLLLGCGDGSVRFYRNTTRSGESRLAPPLELVPRAPAGDDALRLAHPGLRARVAVGDWNGDGRMDLVVGEYSCEEGVAPVLNAEQKQELADTLKESLALANRRGELERAALELWLAKNKVPPEDGALRYDDFLLEWQKTPEAQALAKQQAAVTAVLQKLNPQPIEHGRVWVFLRKGT